MEIINIDQLIKTALEKNASNYNLDKKSQDDLYKRIVKASSMSFVTPQKETSLDDIIAEKKAMIASEKTNNSTREAVSKDER